MRKSSRKTSSGTGLRLIVLALCLVAAQGAAEAAGGVCVSAEIEEPFRLPDGSAHPAGRLTLCHQSDFSPVASIHRSQVDGMTVSMHMSRRGESERNDSDAPVMMFGRQADGMLLLLGYAHSGRDKTTMHAFPRDKKSRQQHQFDVQPDDANPTPVIRLAASLD